MDIVVKDEMLEDVIKPASQQEKCNDVEHQDRTALATEEINNFRLINQALDPENLEAITLHQERDTSNINDLTKGISSELEVLGNPAELPEESRNQRRSVTNVLLSIKSLTQKPIFSPHHTAPVSSLIDQLPATSQILCPSRSVTEQVLVSSEMANKETIQAKEPTERTKTISMEYLPSRRSLKMFQPKLPNKRASSTSNFDLVLSSVSEAQPKNNESSKVLLKALHDVDYGQCIDQEMLPDDQEINSIFDYAVPEGDWDELCKKEALQQNVNISTSQPKDSMNGQKRGRNTDPDSESQREKRGRLDEDGQPSTAFKSSDKSYVSDHSTPHASKGIEQSCNSTSSQDSRADGMSVELNSQQCSQMDSQLPWTSRCEQSLWQNFQDGSITVQDFFVLLGIRILIQKPRYSELPSKRGMAAELTPSEILLDQYVYQPKLQVYDEECHTLFQAIEELKVSTERQHKPLVQVNSLLWEALRMCSENELMCFGATLKNMKSLYSKKSKLLAHKAKVSTYSKLLRTAQIQKEQLQARLSAADQLLAELADCISSLHMDPVRLNGECRTENRTAEIQGCIQAEIDGLKSQQSGFIRENLELEERKQNLLARLGSLQEEARVIGERLQERSFTEWELVKWTDTNAAFNFLYDSLGLSISFGDSIDGENFNNQPCRRISRVTVESQLDDASAPPSTVLVHRLISQYVEKKSAFHEAYKTQNDLPQLLFDLSLVVSRCKLLGEELENLTRWGAIYNVVKVHVQSQEVSLLFSSLATLVKFELIIHLSDTYPTTPLSFTLNNRIGSITFVNLGINVVPIAVPFLLVDLILKGRPPDSTLEDVLLLLAGTGNTTREVKRSHSTPFPSVFFLSLHGWSQISDNDYVLKIISEGYRIELTSRVPQRGIPYNNKFKTSKRFRQIQTVQNGVDQVHHSSYKQRFGNVHSRSEECVLSGPDTSLFSGASEILSKSFGHDLPLPISMPPFRSSIRPKNFHQIGSRGGGFLKKPRNNNNSILGRFSGCGTIKGHSATTQRSGHSSIRGNRMGGQQEKVTFKARIPEDISRSTLGFYNQAVLLTKGQTNLIKKDDLRIPKKSSDDKSSYENLGEDDSMHSVCQMGSGSLKAFTRTDTHGMGSTSFHIRQEARAINEDKKITTMVDPGLQSKKGHPLDINPLCDNHHRCKSVGMGSAPGRKILSGQVARGDQSDVVKLQRIIRSLGSSQKKPFTPKGQTCKNPIRQCNSGILFEASGRFQTQSASRSSAENICLGRRRCLIYNSSASRRVTEHTSRLSKQKESFSNRMGTKSRNVPNSLPPLGNAQDRFIRHKEKFKGSQILFPQPSRHAGSSRRLKSSMERTSVLRISTNSTNSSSAQEDSGRPGNSADDCTILAKEKLVPIVGGHGNGRPYHTPVMEGYNSSRACFTPKPGETASVSMDPERDILKSRGLSDEVITTIQASRKPVTSAIYLKIWKKFCMGSGGSLFSRGDMPISVRTWKTAFLVAITTAKRVGEIQALSIKDPYLQVREDHIILKLDPAFIPKIASAKNRDQEIILPSFCENPSNEKEQALHSLDVRQAVLNYLEATSSWRKDSNLFILFGGGGGRPPMCCQDGLLETELS
ncbi:unnamed protein product, partial [Ranitomeya imitator]